MKLAPQLIPKWPKLAWVASFLAGSRQINVLHGPMVEVHKDWIVEAAWAGPFDSGDFDQTDLVFGSGVRLRANKVVFVSAGTGADRLWYAQHQGQWYVSNSLPALLAIADISLRDDYAGYTFDIETVERLGIHNYKRFLPTTSSDIGIAHFHNLVFDGQSVATAVKTSNTPHFGCFDDYHSFLKDTAAQIAANIHSSERRHAIETLTTISSGYDSPAAAAVAKLIGCTRAATISNSTSLWRGSDSGAEIARAMGLACQVYRRSPRNYRREVTTWSTTGLAAGLSFTVFDYPEPLCLVFTGCYGDTVWDRHYHDLTFPKGDRDALLGEFRVHEGFFHCVVPWWGIQHAQEINALGSREDMQPWSVQSSYDRPVARRLAEQSGAPREMFGIRKKDTSSNEEFVWPYSPSAQASFREFLSARGITAPRPFWVRVLRKIARVENLLYQNVFLKLGLKWRFRPWASVAGTQFLFLWANAELKRQYQLSCHESMPRPRATMSTHATSTACDNTLAHE